MPPHLARLVEVAERKGDFITAREFIHCLSSSIKKGITSQTVRGWFKILADMGLGMITGVGRFIKFKIVTDCGSNVGEGGNNPETNRSNSFSRFVTDVGTVGDLPKKDNILRDEPNESQIMSGIAAEENQVSVSDVPQAASLSSTLKNPLFAHSAHSGNNEPQTPDGIEIENVTDVGNNVGNNSSTAVGAAQAQTAIDNSPVYIYEGQFVTGTVETASTPRQPKLLTLTPGEKVIILEDEPLSETMEKTGHVWVSPLDVEGSVYLSVSKTDLRLTGE